VNVADWPATKSDELAAVHDAAVGFDNDTHVGPVNNVTFDGSVDGVVENAPT
jgi:hypothetical protein